MSRFRVSGPTEARHYVALSALTLAASLAIACGRGVEKPTASNASLALIQLDGSSTVVPISEAVAEEFQKANHDVELTIQIYDLARKHFADQKVGTAFGAGGSQAGLTLEQLLTREQ